MYISTRSTHQHPQQGVLWSDDILLRKPHWERECDCEWGFALLPYSALLYSRTAYAPSGSKIIAPKEPEESDCLFGALPSNCYVRSQKKNSP